MQLRIVGLRKSFGPRLTPLHNINLTIKTGESCMLLGESGSGKTTLLRSIAGLSPIDNGEIWLDKQPLHLEPPFRRNVGMSMQRPVLYPHLNVLDNLRVGFQLHQKHLPNNLRLSSANLQIRIKNVASQLKIDHLLEQFPQRISGGEQYRVSLGRLLIRQPNIWLLDEPFSQLDKGLKEELWTVVEEFVRQLQPIILFVTHDETETKRFGDRVFTLIKGNLKKFFLDN